VEKKRNKKIIPGIPGMVTFTAESEAGLHDLGVGLGRLLVRAELDERESSVPRHVRRILDIIKQDYLN
jgi:hypothetical protein